MTDAQLVAAAFAAEPDAQRRAREALYLRFENLVWHAVNRAAVRFEAEDDDLADAFQEAWVRILAKLPLFRPGRGEASGFVWTVAHRCAFGYFRRFVSASEIELEAVAEAQSREWEHTETMMDVANCMSELEEPTADALLRWTQGFTGREIGEPLGLNAVQAFQKLIHPALRLVQRCLMRKGYAMAAN
jgi:RNA polymerase sigma factor (sigma-70 family)